MAVRQTKGERNNISQRKAMLLTNLLYIRDLYGYSTSELAASCGISAPTMRLIMKDPERLTIRQAGMIADLTGFDLHAFLFEPLIEAEET